MLNDLGIAARGKQMTLIAYAAINRQYFSRAPYRACVDPTAFAL
jgi:hypothetical protein